VVPRGGATDPRYGISPAHEEKGSKEVPKRISITMPDGMFSDLEQRAEQRDITVSELIRRAVSLDRLLDQTEEPVFIGEGRDRRQVVRP
jgi:hypothetical protein